MIGETVLQYIIEKTLESAARFLKERKLKLTVTAHDLEKSIANHTNHVAKWANEIVFKDLAKSKLTAQVFIDLDIYLIPKKIKLNSSEVVQKISSRSLFNDLQKQLVILGQPGAGKTTLMKFICRSVLFDEDYYPEQLKIPLLIRLREYNARLQDKNEKNPIINVLFETLGLSLESKTGDYKEEDLALAKERILVPILDEVRAIIMLDGYDEISTKSGKEKVLNDFRKLVFSLNQAKVILTSRSSDFNYSFENIDVLEIAPLSQEQISEFAVKWLRQKERVSDFMLGLKQSPFMDTAIRPLTLAHLCAIYERSGKIPDKPKTIYRKIVNLLLEEWDEQRDIIRLSRYANFEVDRKLEFLCRLAFEITIKYNSSIFSSDDLKEIYQKVYVDFDLKRNEADRVVTEIEMHTGLILQAGYEEYEFAHKSIHEFLCAEHIVKLPSIPSYTVLLKIPNELSIAVTISSSPSQYFCEIVNILSQKNVKGTFITNFVNRLVLEKPDFNTSKEVGFALILLYTLFRSSDTHLGQLKLFEFDLPVQFERFIELIFKRNKPLSIGHLYTCTGKSLTEKEETVLHLKKKDGAYNYGGFRLPKVLYVKETFVSDKFEGQ